MNHRDECCDDEHAKHEHGKPESRERPDEKHGHGHDERGAPRGHEHGHGGRKHFLAVVSKEEAERKWYAALQPEPLGVETVALDDAHGRVLAADVTAPIDLPPFDRAVVDGFAVQARDTFAADEGKPAKLGLELRTLAAGEDAAGLEVAGGRAVEIATGAPIPRGANAVVMVEYTDRREGQVWIERAATPGEGIQLAGSDVRRGEVLFRRGERLGARETGVLAALGLGTVECYRRPRVAVISTGDELVSPGGGALRPGQIYDSNARLVADLVREHGGEPTILGRARDRAEDLDALLERARGFDLVVLSGGTSKGAGDLTFRLVGDVAKPGILVHGVALKPGKPTVLAAWGKTPVAILPGFPTSCAITFDVFVKPLVRILAGLERRDARGTREVRLAVTAPAGQGRHEYVLVNLVASPETPGELLAYPLLKGSGSVASFAQADGFIEVPPGRDRAMRGEAFRATLLAPDRRPFDLVVAASPCPGLDALARVAREVRDVHVKVLALGSRAGAEAILRGEADLAAFPAAVGADPLATLGSQAAAVEPVGAYARKQVLAARPGTFARLGDSPAAVLSAARPLGLRLVSRHSGSVTRALVEALLDEAARAAGVAPDAFRASFAGVQDLARTHEGAAAAVAAGTADLAVCVESVARGHGLEVMPVREEHVFLLVPRSRRAEAKVAGLLETLGRAEYARALEGLAGFAPIAGRS